VALFASARIAAQNDVIAPGTDLTIEGIPPIPASLAKAADFDRNSVAYSLLGWDPEKLEIVLIRRHALAWQIGRAAAPGETPRTFTYVPAGCYETYYHPSGKSLIFRIDDTLGKEITQLYRYDIESRSKTLLTDGKSRNLYPIWSNSAEWLMYSSTRRNGKDLDIYAVKPADPKTDHLVAQLTGEDWAAFDWSPNDRKVILSDYRSINESYLWTLDVATGQKTLLTPIQKGQRVFNGSYAQFSKDGKGVYHITDRDSEFQRLAYVDIATGRYTYLTTDLTWDVEQFTLSPDRTRLAFITNEEGISRLHVLNTETGRELTTPKLPPGVISGLKWHNNSIHLGFALNSTTSPGDIYSIDLKEGKALRWTESSIDGIDAAALPNPEIIKWKSFDGRLIPGFLYRPPANFTGRRPVLIDIHGGPDIQHRPDFRGKDNYFTSQLGVAKRRRS
jgi:dipeptidyl aminopeptidase/acylaminoacyl peptidase